MSIDDKLSEVFDVEPIRVDESNTQVITADGHVIPPQDNAFEHDYNTTRNNLHTLLQQGQDALNAALEVAKQSEHPRAFEVVGNLMKHISDINHQLLDLHKKKQVFENPKGAPTEEQKQVTNNSIFVGSTTELSRMLDDLRKGK
jgi:hypothetical protein